MKDRIEGSAKQAKGKLKQAAGKLMGDEKTRQVAPTSMKERLKTRPAA